MSERISVIVPVCEARKNLKKCLEGLRQQTWGELEIILADGSGEGEKYAGTDGRVRVIAGSYADPTEAALAGVAAAGGELIGFADPGNRLEPQMYEKLREVLTAKNADIAICRNRIEPELTFGANEDEDPEDNDEPVNPAPRWDKLISGRKAVYDMTVGLSIEGVLWDKLFRRSLFEEDVLSAGHESSRLGEERLLAALFDRARTIVCLREPLYERKLTDSGSFYAAAEDVCRYQERIALLKETRPEFLPSVWSRYRDMLEALVLKALDTDWSEAKKHRALLEEELWPFYRDEGAAAVSDLSWQKRTKYRILLKNPALFWDLWPMVRGIKSRILH